MSTDFASSSRQELAAGASTILTAADPRGPARMIPSLPTTSAPSRWRTRVAAARPEWAVEIDALAAATIDRDAVRAAVAVARGDGWRDEAHLAAGLRRARTIVLAALVDRDLGGRADLAEVVAATTALAEIAIGEALPFHARKLAAVHGVPHGADSGSPQDLLVVAMGKLGGAELNVSSDIDLIFVFGEPGETLAPVAAEGEPRAVRPTANEDFFTRLGRRLIATLAETTADGFVFRVDMRLRPDGDAGPLVVSLPMLERYLVANARDWERFAWIKARVVSEPVFGVGAERELAALATPFVYRRYLDFGAIDALRALHRLIRDEAARREAVRHGRSGREGAPRIDVKLGRGGIREIEFIVQHFQLIRGGREPRLRLAPTRATLARLVDDGLIDAASGSRLAEAYAFLRNVEHRLQYLDDAQTHTLPTAEDDRARIAAMTASLPGVDADAGFEGLVAALETHRRFVEAQFDAVFGDVVAPVDEAPGTPDAAALWSGLAADPATVDDEVFRTRLAALGFDAPDEALARLVALARSARLRTLGAASRTRLDALVPRIVGAVSRTARPSAVLARWFDVVEAIAGRSAYLALLDEYPAALDAVTRLLAASPWAAQYLARHPVLLDELIDAPGNERPPRDAADWSAHWVATAAALVSRLAEADGDTERRMDLLREVHHVETFRLLVDDLDGRLTIEALSDQLSALADLVLDAAVADCWSAFVASRRDANASPTLWPTRPAFAVIAYGKLGGKELGYASDLDLVFLFDAAGDAEAAAVYARFAQRLNVWLTARTTAGALFEIDLRLRPDGAAGLVVSSFDAWSRYERREHDVGAWTWEHQALTRARFVAGDRSLGAAFESERLAILAMAGRDAESRRALRAEIVSMRKRMHDGHPNRSGRFDVKHDDGGMVDIEFAVQYLVLANGAAHAALFANVGNIALLARAADARLVANDVAAATADAYRRFRAVQHASRLADPQAHAVRVAPDAFAAERDAVGRLWRALFGERSAA